MKRYTPVTPVTYRKYKCDQHLMFTKQCCKTVLQCLNRMPSDTETKNCFKGTHFAGKCIKIQIQPIHATLPYYQNKTNSHFHFSTFSHSWLRSSTNLCECPNPFPTSKYDHAPKYLAEPTKICERASEGWFYMK